MKILVKATEGRPSIACRLPFEGADHVVTDGPCPACGSELCKLQGGKPRPSADEQAWEADACAACCGAEVGVLRVEVDTLFGVREDRAVLCGRCRVY